MATAVSSMSGDELLAEAGLLLALPAASRVVNYDQLAAAKQAVDNLPAAQRVQGATEVEALRKAVEVALAGREPSHRGVYACIALSMALMFLVGSLSLVYNKGAALLSEIESVAARQPDRRFGQLERQLLIAQDQLFKVDQGQDAAAACPPGSAGCDQKGGVRGTVDELAHESSYVTLHELRDLNFTLKSLETRVAEFENLSESPLPGALKLEAFVGSAMASGGNLLRSLAAPGDAEPSAIDANPVSAAGSAAPTTPRSGSDTMNFFCRAQTSNPGDPKADPPQDSNTNGRAASEPNSQILGMDMGKIFDQACKYSLSYVSMTVPSVSLWAIRIKDAIDPYAMWILPCLYAALGSMIYYMRLILDPVLPNPPAFRIAHRMALAALAGMILAWFWEPAFGANAEFKTVGFGLFTFAFIVGFSIDIFFAFLDRLVLLSNNVINKLGSS